MHHYYHLLQIALSVIALPLHVISYNISYKDTKDTKDIVGFCISFYSKPTISFFCLGKFVFQSQKLCTSSQYALENRMWPLKRVHILFRNIRDFLELCSYCLLAWPSSCKLILPFTNVSIFSDKVAFPLTCNFEV